MNTAVVAARDKYDQATKTLDKSIADKEAELKELKGRLAFLNGEIARNEAFIEQKKQELDEAFEELLQVALKTKPEGTIASLATPGKPETEATVREDDFPEERVIGLTEGATGTITCDIEGDAREPFRLFAKQDPEATKAADTLRESLVDADIFEEDEDDGEFAAGVADDDYEITGDDTLKPVAEDDADIEIPRFLRRELPEDDSFDRKVLADIKAGECVEDIARKHEVHTAAIERIAEENELQPVYRTPSVRKVD